MAWLWGRVDRLAPGAVGMLVLHNAVFWAGLALCAHRCVRRHAWAAATIPLPFYAYAVRHTAAAAVLPLTLGWWSRSR